MSIKKIITICLAFLLLAGLAGCSSKPAEEGNSDKVAVTVTVWGPQEDQSDDNGKWLQTQCEAFAAEHPEWEITFNYGVCSEGDAKTNVTTDPAAAADVYMYANDQIPDLLKSGALAEFGGNTLSAIKENNSQTTVNTVSYDGQVLGVPYTANTWFMYYNKAVISDEDAKNLDTMLTKGKVAFPLDNSWYIAAFYVANGCTMFGENGDDAAAGFDFSGDKAVEVTNYLVDLVANPNFVNGDVSTGNDIDAFFSGTWDYQKAKDAYGDNLGIAPAPSFTLNGEEKQMKSFAGSKAVGVNPQAALYAEHPEIAVALAAYLGNTASQQAHYDKRNIIPTDKNINVGDDALAKAQMDTMAYASIVQPLQANMGNWWTPAQSMGAELVAGTVTHDNAAEKTEAMNNTLNNPGVQ
ncbi:MAG: sugar-binding protein [Erysipelotrichaceae bacterium]|nr:sugar-binding protein [Erysipelotrichaceae bacterium]